MSDILAHAVPVRAPTDAEAAQALLVKLVNPEDLPSGGAAEWGDITGTLSDQTDLQGALDAKLPIARLEDGWIMASAWTPRKTNGAEAGDIELANGATLDVLKFDTTTEEGATIPLQLPTSWNEGTVKFEPMWTGDGSLTGGVAWGFRAYAVSNDDVLNGTFGTEQVTVDSVTAAGDIMTAPPTSALTIGQTPSPGDLIVLEITREVANGSDNLAGDACLIGVRLQITHDTLVAAL
jgi:hypothetical protein